jgi:hypothetical protein
MIKGFFGIVEMPRPHISRVKDGCTCEYCCSVRDAHDEYEMEEEYKVAKFVGGPIFKSIGVGDRVQYYRLPYEHRNAVYTNYLKYIQECATTTFQGVVLSKTEHSMKVLADGLGDSHNVGPSECCMWGMHKINIDNK